MKVLYPAMSTLIAMTFAISSLQTGCADEAEILRAETEADAALSNGDSCDRSDLLKIFRLACVYQTNGERVKAADTFDKVLVLQKSLDQSRMPEQMLSWAMYLSRESKLSVPPISDTSSISKSANVERKLYLEDIDRAAEWIKKAITLLDRQPVYDRDRLAAHLQLYEFLLLHRSPQLALAQFRKLDKLLRTAEIAHLKRDEILSVASVLETLSTHFAPANYAFASGDPVSVSLISDSNFADAEALRLRALSLTELLPDSDPAKIDAHREMLRWYESFNRKGKSEEQLEQLAKLLGTRDSAALNPPRARCPGMCGMG